jgi:uncharacterized membrane protein YsdA (DUF1294 family)
LNYAHEAESYALHYLSHVKLPWLLFGGYVFLVGLFGFFAMGVDKQRASNGGWRLSEFFLLEVAFAGGCLGILAGAQVFHHKYEKEVFTGVLLGALITWFFIFQAMIHFFGPPPFP